MNNDKLKTNILNYIKNDKTHSAIMITAPWGTGKSYFVNNELIPFLEKEKKGYALVSLYGLTELTEISKALYMELRLNKYLRKIKRKHNISNNKVINWFTKHGEEVAHSVVGIGKTVIKGITSFFNIDINVSSKDMYNIFKSIDLSDKLIILEDLERSTININDILGYVNNLVEQDGVKVLLIANEEEIIYRTKKIVKTNTEESDTTEKNILIEQSKKYLREKEKTISDTIHYSGNIERAIENIIKSFDNKILNRLIEKRNGYLGSKIAKEIYISIMLNKDIECCNLRAVIYACQKTVDLFKSVNNEIDLDFAEKTFLSIVAFSLRKKKKDILYWNNETNYSQSLGTYKYPLLKYCYDFIQFQYSQSEEFKEASEMFIRQRVLNDKLEKNNKYFNIICNFYEQAEEEVRNAVKQVKELLRNNGDIEPSQYGKLASFLIAIKNIIGNDEDVNECKQIMLEHLSKSTESKFTNGMLIHNSYYLEGEALEELKEFNKRMLGIDAQNQNKMFDFDYNPENLEKFCKQVIDSREKYIKNHIFARKFDIDKLIAMLTSCTSRQIAILRDLFFNIYSFSNLNEYFSNDKEMLIKIKDGACGLINKSDKLDKIQIMQLNAFMNNIQDVLDKL